MYLSIFSNWYKIKIYKFHCGKNNFDLGHCEYSLEYNVPCLIPYATPAKIIPRATPIALYIGLGIGVSISILGVSCCGWIYLRRRQRRGRNQYNSFERRDPYFSIASNSSSSSESNSRISRSVRSALAPLLLVNPTDSLVNENFVNVDVHRPENVNEILTL